MEVDFRVIRNISARKFISALLRDGFFLRRSVGSHQRYQHSDGRRVTVTFHSPSETFRRKTLGSMIEQAEWNNEDLRRLGLI